MYYALLAALFWIPLSTATRSYLLKLSLSFRRNDSNQRNASATQRCIKSSLSIARTQAAPDLGTLRVAEMWAKRRDAERGVARAYVAKPLSRRYYARGTRYSWASALPQAHRRFVACNGHVHPPKSNVCLAPVIYDYPAAIYTYRAHTLAGLKSHRAFWTWNMGAPRGTAAANPSRISFTRTRKEMQLHCGYPLCIPAYYVLCANTHIAIKIHGFFQGFATDCARRWEKLFAYKIIFKMTSFSLNKNSLTKLKNLFPYTRILCIWK